MTLHHPAFVTEREPDGTYEDCVPCSGLMMANAHEGADNHPPTQVEYEALRAASGVPPAGPVTPQQLNRGLQVRYGYQGVIRDGFASVWAGLVPGQSAALFGFLSNFPAGHRLRRWQPTFDKGHCVFGGRYDASERIWWMDPLAPRQFRVGTETRQYEGEWVTKAELAIYMQPTLDSAVLLSIGEEATAVIYAPVKRMSYSLRAVPGTSVYDEPSLASHRSGIVDDPTRRFEARALTADGIWTSIVGLKADGVTPDITAPTLASWVQSDTLRDPKEITLGGGFTQAQVDEAVRLAVAPLTAKISAAKSALS